MTTIITLDLKKEYFFRTCSVASNLVTSLDFNPIRSATMLCLFQKTRSGSLATHFILISSTATSSAIGGYVVDPESFGQNEKAPSSNKERVGKSLVLIPKVDLPDAIIFLTCKHDLFLLLCFIFFYLILMNFSKFSG